MAAQSVLAGCSKLSFTQGQSFKPLTPSSSLYYPSCSIQHCLTFSFPRSSRYILRRFEEETYKKRRFNVQARAGSRREEVKTAQSANGTEREEGRTRVQPLDEEWEDWDSAALDGGGARGHVPGNAADTSSDEWESLTEEEEAALLEQLEKSPPVKVLSEGEGLEQVQATSAQEIEGEEDWRSVSEEEKQSVQEQLASEEASPFLIERVSEEGESAPLESTEAEGLGELWNDPGLLLIEKVNEEGSEDLQKEEVEKLQELWGTATSVEENGTATSVKENGTATSVEENEPTEELEIATSVEEKKPAKESETATNVEKSKPAEESETATSVEENEPAEENEPVEEWVLFTEEQLSKVQAQLDAFKSQFSSEDESDSESESDDELREDMWQGDLEGAMTPDEEAELLREAERELAQGFGGLDSEEEADAELVQKLNATSKFSSQQEGDESTDDEAQLLREAELELQTLNASKSEDGEEWGDGSGEDLTEDEVLIRVLNQQRSEELDAEEEDEDSDSEANEDVWVGDLEGEMSPEEEAAILAEAEKELAMLRGDASAAGEGASETDDLRLKMVDTLRELVDEKPAKQTRKAARSVLEKETANKQREEGPMSKLEEAKMLRRMEQELAELRKDDRAVEYDEEGREKKKIPNEMRCFDTAKIYAKAGDGGNGCVAFRREKFVAYGGPSGGNGGRGGHVFFEVDASMNSLQPFRKQIHFRAGRGGHGEGSKCEGHKGDDITIKVPPGTVVKRAREGDEEEGEWLMELIKPGEKQLLIPGGRGGRGNTSFKSAQNKAPVIAENGEEGRESWIELELKLVADVGIVGVPNAGKSTLLSVISAARPKIANYPFTTLVPNLGVAEIDYETIVFADVPGLLEGAHTGHGLGQEFLRHCERSRVLVHVIDGTSPQPVQDYEAICAEMELFNPVLAQKPQIVAFNKMDIPEVQVAWPAFQEAMQAKGVEAVAISAVAQENVQTIVRKTQALLKEIANPYEYDPFEQAERRVKVVVPASNKGPPIDVFDIEQDPHTRTWVVSGEGLERFTQMTNWEYYEAVKRFQKVLDSSGVNQELKRRGVREGDTVVLGEMEFAWIDKDDWNTFGDGWTRGTRGSKHWPH